MTGLEDRDQMHSCYFLAGDVIVSHREAADRLLLVVSGTVKILLPGHQLMPL